MPSILRFQEACRIFAIGNWIWLRHAFVREFEKSANTGFADREIPCRKGKRRGLDGTRLPIYDFAISRNDDPVAGGAGLDKCPPGGVDARAVNCDEGPGR